MAGSPWSPYPAARVHSVLFACSENAVRSPMAAALAEHRFGRLLHVESAGVRPGERNAFVTSVMAEIGIDLSRHRPQTFENLEDTCFDLIVSLSPEAHHRALEFTRTMAVEVLYWPTLDATGIEGSRAAVMDAFRGVREALATRVSTVLARDPPGSTNPVG